MSETISYTVVDVETTVRNTEIGTNKAFPFAPDNEIILTGSRECYSSLDIPRVKCTLPGEDAYILGSVSTKVLIGHNLSFDLHYLRKHNYVIPVMLEETIHYVPIDDWLINHSIWDTQVAEYILSGQSVLYPSLDYCALKYDAPMKDDRMKILWNAGVQTEDMIPEMLTEYLEGDLEATEVVYLAQVEEAEKTGQLPLIQAMCRSVVAYEDMEWNGMSLDLDLLAKQKDQVLIDQKITEEMLRSQLPEEISQEINFGSTAQLSTLLFGGTFTWKIKEEVGLYKNGNIKYKQVEHRIDNPLFVLVHSDDWKTDKPGVYATSDDVLAAIYNNMDHTPLVRQFVGGLREMRGYAKELAGYYEPLPSLVCDDNVVHQNINNVATHTARLSQNQPNLQNMNNKSDLKKCFVSRWGSEGRIVEIDYSQLEVIGLAYSCRDSNLLRDLRGGLDMHQVTLDKVQHLLPTVLSAKEMRRVVKGVNFGLLYGGGVKKLAKTSGLAESVVRKIKKTLYTTYPGIKDWQDANVERVEKNKVHTYQKSKGGYPICKSTLWTDTGRTYTFMEGDALSWQRSTGIKVSFNRSQICNYPIQGFATGDIVPTVIGEVHEFLKNSPEYKDKCLMVNTTHDSITFDCEQNSLGAVYQIIKIMEDAPEIMGEIYGINFDLPLEVEVSSGLNWKDQVVWEKV